MRKITFPILLLAGRYDLFFDPEIAASRFRKCILNVQTEVIPDAGDVVFVEKTEFITTRKSDFLGVKTD